MPFIHPTFRGIIIFAFLKRNLRIDENKSLLVFNRSLASTSTNTKTVTR